MCSRPLTAPSRRGGAEPPPAFTLLKDARIVGASLKEGLAEIILAFTASFADGHDAIDVWTFARRVGDNNPNWTLVATSGDLPE